MISMVLSFHVAAFFHTGEGCVNVCMYVCMSCLPGERSKFIHYFCGSVAVIIIGTIPVSKELSWYHFIFLFPEF